MRCFDVVILMLSLKISGLFFAFFSFIVGSLVMYCSGSVTNRIEHKTFSAVIDYALRILDYSHTVWLMN